MSRMLTVIPECYVDTNLISYLLGREVNHQYGCNNVAKCMQRLKDSFCIGIVDDDKNKKADYPKEFLVIAYSQHLQVLKHRERPHFYIFIKKAAEDFILSAAKELKIDLEACGLSNDLEALKKVTKSRQSNKDERLIKAFRQLEGASDMKRLAKTLKYLTKHKYASDLQVIEAVKDIFADPDRNVVGR